MLAAAADANSVLMWYCGHAITEGHTIAQQFFSKAEGAFTSSSANAGMRQVDDEYKLKQNIRIAMLYLEDDDAINAEAFIKKAATLIANCKAGILPCALSPHNRPNMCL